MASEYVLWPQMPVAWLGVRRSLRSGFLILCIAVFVALLSGCPNKTTVTEPPPPPAPPAPTASIKVSLANVPSGQSVMVTWATANADEVNIDQIGLVTANGSLDVAPMESTTYRLTAKGPGGVQEASARVTVVASAAPEPPKMEEVELEGAREGRLDVLFDYDDSSIRSDQLDTIKNDADFLKQHAEVRITVEGHCDELGSTEYNVVLGELRAREVKSALEKAGISASRIKIFSYGKENPICGEENQACWQKNRRAHIAITGVD